jgi:hypothetical protein
LFLLFNSISDYTRRNPLMAVWWEAFAVYTLYLAITGDLLPDANRNWPILIAGVIAVALSFLPLIDKIDGHDGGLAGNSFRKEAAGILVGMTLVCIGSGLYSIIEIGVINVGVFVGMLGMYGFIDALKVHEKEETEANYRHDVPFPLGRVVVSYIVFATGLAIVALPML